MSDLDLFQGHAGRAAERCADEIAHLRRQARNVAHGTRTGALGGAKGLPHQIGDIGFILASGGGSVDKHYCYRCIDMMFLYQGKNDI